MRRVTRNVILATLLVVVLLLALGALPQFLRSGDPYYMEATAVDAAPADVDPVNASAVPSRRYPYTAAALDAAANASDGVGRSDPYWRGPFGVKGAFTHSPFDEMGAYRDQYPGAVRGERAFLVRGNATYRLAIVQP
ncbi:hypothetical protein [Halorarius halobius]|uniref:hypothetical protein n=1 Tax=Halorarius halobius TaxID=2962671 RepID=UPI0020CD5BE5|nr:hypothetical protein [Halorarius halobius]